MIYYHLKFEVYKIFEYLWKYVMLIKTAFIWSIYRIKNVLQIQ